LSSRSPTIVEAAEWEVGLVVRKRSKVEGLSIED